MRVVSAFPVLVFISTAFGLAQVNESDEELEVILQFFEFDLEDNCVYRSEAKWEFLNGTSTNLSKLFELELNEAQLYKNESKTLQKAYGKHFNNKRLQRLFDIFFHPGPPLLGTSELKEYKEYSVKLEEIRSRMSIGCHQKTNYGDYEELKNLDKDCIPKYRKDVNKILATEYDKNKLKDIWHEWYEELELQNRKTKFDFIQQLSILDIEAEFNEADDLSDYWLKKSDITKFDYQKISQLWKEIIPLYQKIRKYLAKHLERLYGSDIFINKKLFPAHLLGSLNTQNWIVTAEKLGAFVHAEPYKYLASKLNGQDIESVYKMADDFTAEFKMGDLPTQFYNISIFNYTSSHCINSMMDYCTRKNNQRVISCSDQVTVSRFIDIHEEVAKIKHLLNAGREGQDEENGFLFREGPRDSVIYEAVAGLSSLIAMTPTNLRKQNLLPSEIIPNEEIVSLLLTALHVIPTLPYYLASDLWRINALKEMDASAGETSYDPSSTQSSSTTYSYAITESVSDSSNMNKRELSSSYVKCVGSENNEEPCFEKNKTEDRPNNFSQSYPSLNGAYTTSTINALQKIYEFHNLTIDWWKYRENLQGIGNSDGKYFPDYLQDEKIIWNKPYISKFLGKILQFQLLPYVQSENSFMNTIKVQTLLQKGKSIPYEEILETMFNISEISTGPLLQYFKPLEEFLDAGGKFKNDTTFQLDDLNLFSESYSMNSPSHEQDKNSEGDSNTTVFIILALVALGLVSVTISVVLKRHRRKQRAKERRKTLNELLN